jgi:hypothetical protein
MEDDIGRDDEVGEANFKLTDFIAKDLSGGVSGKWFTLTYTSDGKKSAEIQIDTTFVSN